MSDTNGLPVEEPEQPDSMAEEEAPSLSELSQAFAEAMGKSPATDVQTSEPDAVGDCEEEIHSSVQHADAASDVEATPLADGLSEAPPSPKSILEAILFVGHPENEPITSHMVASLLRGVEPAEIDDLVRELNDDFAASELALQIHSVDGGYRMQLSEDFEPVRQRFFGRMRQARLSRAAIDVLAIVAYNQPVSRKRVDELLGGNCGKVLNQLVRRELLALADTSSPRNRQYVTTNRFLALFEMSSLEDLPRSDQPE